MTTVKISDPSALTLQQICDLLFDISLSKGFTLLSPTDQQYLLAVKGRVRRKLNAAGIKTFEDFAEEHEAAHG